MACSPHALLVDVMLWRVPGFPDFYRMSIQNLTSMDDHDCALTSVPCESNITKRLSLFFSSDNSYYFWIDLAVVYILFPTIIIVGIFCNVMNIIIFSKHEVANDSTNILFRNLAISDLIVVLLLAILTCSFFLCFIDVSAALTGTNIFLNYANVNRHLNMLSLDFVAVLSVQRATAVLLPFKVSTIFSRRNTHIISAVFVLICFAAFLPPYTSVRTEWVYHLYFNKYISLGWTAIFGFDFVYQSIYQYLNIHSVIGLVVIFIAVFLTINQLYKHAKSRGDMTLKTVTNTENSVGAANTRELKVIKLSLAICLITFTIYSIAFAVNWLIQSNQSSIFRNALSFYGIWVVTVLNTVNCSFNFFVYMAMSTKFRESFKSFFRSKKRQTEM